MLFRGEYKVETGAESKFFCFSKCYLRRKIHFITFYNAFLFFSFAPLSATDFFNSSCMTYSFQPQPQKNDFFLQFFFLKAVILGSHGNSDEELNLLGCYPMLTGK